MSLKNKYCLVYNFPQHYREGIFLKMSEELGCDFYFGDYLDLAPDIKSMNLDKFDSSKSVVTQVRNIRFLKYFIWQSGALKVLTKPYKHIILYGETFYLSNWIIMFFAFFLGKKTYLWTHGLYKDLSWKAKIINFPYYHMASSVLLYGDYAKNKMIEKYGFDREKLKCIYNSLNYSEQVKLRSTLSTNIYSDYFKNDLPVLLYVGRIQIIKKIDLLLKLVNDLKGTFPVNLIIIGEGKNEVDLKKLSSDLSIDKNVWFYGGCYDEKKLAELISNASLCISPGNIGLTAIHSLTYGTPAVTHSNFLNQMPEFEVIEDGVTGVFFLENNYEDLKEKVLDWFRNSEYNRDEIRQKCYKKIDMKYNPSYQINVFKDLENK